MASFECPYCNKVMSISADTNRTQYPCFENYTGHFWNGVETITYNSCLSLSFYKCPHCEEYTIYADGIGSKIQDVHVPIRPISSAKKIPDYIPKAIRQDYEEACAIVTLSPKASATLSRRCLQGMIRNFWGISKVRLIDEINDLQNKIPTQQWKVIDGVRRIGNIGAHMEKDINLIVDIDPDEAQKLIKLIEHLLDQWYINRHEQELLYADIIGIDEAKQSERKKTE